MWCQGLRGIASLFVVSSHLVLAYRPDLLGPKAAKGSTIPIHSYPFIRVYAEGRPWVAIFLILTGYVNSLRPIKLARAGQTDAALVSLANSTFRRTARLVLPCFAATVMSWGLCQLGLYQICTRVGGDWLRNTCPRRSESLLGGIADLLQAVFRTWSVADNVYDRNQWTMSWFLTGSFALFVTLLGTVKTSSTYRAIVFFALFLYKWQCTDAMIGMPIFGGALLAELSYSQALNNFRALGSPLTKSLPLAIVGIGWATMSFPDIHPEWAGWSNLLLQAGIRLFPAGAEIHSFWSVIGALLLVGGICLSAPLQQWLSHPRLIWLGHLSMPIYLLHGPILRSGLNWLLAAFVPKLSEADEFEGGARSQLLLNASPLGFVVALPIFLAVLLFAAGEWARKVEPMCERITTALEEVMTKSQLTEYRAV